MDKEIADLITMKIWNLLTLVKEYLMFILNGGLVHDKQAEKMILKMANA